MNFVRFILYSAAITAAPSAPLAAQSMTMPGMTMPMPAKKKLAAKKTRTSKAKRSVSPAATAPKSVVEHEGMVMLPPSKSAAPPPSTMPGMDMGTAAPATRDMPMPAMENHGSMKMGGVLGPYPMERESSGTAWQPDASDHLGLMTESGGWTLMAHGVLNLSL